MSAARRGAITVVSGGAGMGAGRGNLAQGSVGGVGGGIGRDYSQHLSSIGREYMGMSWEAQARI